MAVKEKACLNCKRIYIGDRCPNCAQTQFSDSFKGRVIVFNPESSEIATRMKIKEKGEFAIKTK